MRQDVCDRLLNCRPPKQRSVENWVRAMCFAGPEWIPTVVAIMQATWMKYGAAIEDILVRHPKLFPGYKKGSFKGVSLDKRTRPGEWTDAWGVRWRNIEAGLDSIPLEDQAPLRDWSALEDYRPPDVSVNDWGDRIDWDGMPERFRQAKEAGRLAAGGLDHGFMYMRLYYLRGFTNLMMDIASGDPRLERLIEMVAARNRALVERYIECGAEMIWAGDDLGMQTALPMSPEDWRRYIKPAYMDIFEPCRENAVGVYLHSDGHMLEIIPDLVECGVTVVNPQIRANGLEGLVQWAKGRVAICLDLDRQLFPFATPDEIRAHIREAVEALGTPEGGLMLHAECEPDVPLENIEAICAALEEVGAGQWM